MRQMRNMLAQAERPFVIVGGGGWSEQACADFRAFVHTYNLPVGCSYRCQDLIDNRDPHYVGDVAVGLNPKLAERIKSSDVLLVVGARLGEWTTGNYTLIDIPRPKQKLIHVHAGAEELGRVYQGDLLINSGMPEFAAAAKALEPISERWSEWTGGARADLEACGRSHRALRLFAGNRRSGREMGDRARRCQARTRGAAGHRAGRCGRRAFT